MFYYLFFFLVLLYSNILSFIFIVISFKNPKVKMTIKSTTYGFQHDLHCGYMAPCGILLRGKGATVLVHFSWSFGTWIHCGYGHTTTGDYFRNYLRNKSSKFVTVALSDGSN